MRRVLVPFVAAIIAVSSSITARAHHAEQCKALGAKYHSKSKKVRVVHHCMAAHPHDRENAKR